MRASDVALYTNKVWVVVVAPQSERFESSTSNLRIVGECIYKSIQLNGTEELYFGFVVFDY